MNNKYPTKTQIRRSGLTGHAAACAEAGGKLVVIAVPRFLIWDKRCPIEGDLSPVMNGPDAHMLSPGCGRMHYQYGFATLPLVPCGGTLIGIDRKQTRMFCDACIGGWSI